MYISKMILTNFKIFEGEHTLNFKSGINFFVGDNNSGKTTVFKAIEFIQSGKNKEEWITKGKENEHVSVEIEFSGDNLVDIIKENNLKKYEKYISHNSTLTIMRSSKSDTWIDAKGNEKTLELKNIRILNPQTNKYENPSGIDNIITALFDAQFVYSNIKMEDYQDFGKTKIVGKLINEITRDFQKHQIWIDLQNAHSKAFGEEGLTPILRNMQDRLETILKDQYGETKVEFNFGLPEIENFFKTGSILLEDNGVKTPISEKGTGMQRALALSLIQVYAQIDTKELNDLSKPLLFFIDEPETFLHPQAQDRLLKSLNNIAKTSQIFITTHSPYLLKSFEKENHQITIFSKKMNEAKLREGIELNMFPYSPSWGEINYLAFEVISEEFHNELYGYLHNYANENNFTFENGNKTVGPGIVSFDQWLSEQDAVPLTNQGYQNTHRGYTDKTLPQYIRNYIDHPGDYFDDSGVNIRNKPSNKDIRQSIEFMLKIKNELCTR